MKKILSILMVATLIFAVSCNKADKTESAAEYVEVTYTVLAGDALTKAYYGDGTLATDLSWQVFRKDMVDNAEVWTPVTPATSSTTKLNTSPESWQVTMKLAKSYTFRVAFWAQSENVPEGAFDITDLRAVAVDYTKFEINNDNLDVFCNYAEVTVTGTLTQDVVLYRPLAQVNVLATDYADYVASAPATAAETLEIAVKIENVPNLLNVVTKATEGDADLDLAAAPVDGDEFGNTGYYYLAMAYILGNQEQALADNTQVVINNDTQNPMVDLEFSNMPFRANYRTNIIGQLLTGSLTYNVVIEPAFETPDYEMDNVEAIAPGLVLNRDNGFYYASSDEGLQAATGIVVDGDVVVLKNGTYNAGAWTRFSKNVTLKAENAKMAIMDGKTTIEGNKTLKIEGIKFYNQTPYTVPTTTHQYHNKTASTMVASYDGSIEVDNCEFTPTNEDAAIRLYGANSANDHLTITNCAFAGTYSDEFRPIMCQGSLDVEGCTFDNVERYAVQLYGTGGAYASTITFINNKVDSTPSDTKYSVTNILSVGSGSNLSNVTILVKNNTDLDGVTVPAWTYACKKLSLIDSANITYADGCDAIEWQLQSALENN